MFHSIKQASQHSGYTIYGSCYSPICGATKNATATKARRYNTAVTSDPAGVLQLAPVLHHCKAPTLGYPLATRTPSFPKPMGPSGFRQRLLRTLAHVMVEQFTLAKSAVITSGYVDAILLVTVAQIQIHNGHRLLSSSTCKRFNPQPSATFWTSRGHRSPPPPLPLYMPVFYRAQGSAFALFSF